MAEAANKHDIWHRDHKTAEDRWVSDKVLQQRGWVGAVSVDTDVGERAHALAAVLNQIEK